MHLHRVRQRSVWCGCIRYVLDRIRPGCCAVLQQQELSHYTHARWSSSSNTFSMRVEKALECWLLTGGRKDLMFFGGGGKNCVTDAASIRAASTQTRECEELKLALEESVRLRRKTEIDMRERHQRVVKELQRKVEGGKQPGTAQRLSPPAFPSISSPSIPLPSFVRLPAAVRVSQPKHPSTALSA